MRKPVCIVALFFFFWASGSLFAEGVSLQKVILKIEGVQNPSSVEKVHKALLSVPGVKKAEVRGIKRRWLFFKNYDNLHIAVEFEQGALTSENLVNAVEWVSDQNNIYKVKFIE